MQVKALVENVTLFCLLFLAVIITNYNVIDYNLMYPEQPTIYIINQSIHSVSDLLRLYLHPMLLHADIAFFRPSGHFLMYQLLAPIFGWHNTKAYFIVSFLFLTLIGFFIIKTYRLLFPGFTFGGWIVFGIYLMHPALSISRLTLMHFDFAYVAFSMAAFYSFALFTKQWLQSNQFKIGLLAASLFFYAIAVSFKESAIMLGPMMFVYLTIMSYQGENLFTHINALRRNHNIIATLIAITLTSLLLALYLLASWPRMDYGSNNFSSLRTIGAMNLFFRDIFAFNFDLINGGYIAAPLLPWRTIVIPMAVRLILWGFLIITLWTISTLLMRSATDSAKKQLKKSCLFLLITSVLFLFLPFAWGMGGPWHYSLFLISFGMMIGLSIERLISKTGCRLPLQRFIMLSAFLLLVCFGIRVNQVNIAKYSHLPEPDVLGLQLNKTAVFAPPAVKSRLTSHSIILVEDSFVHSDYLLGNSAYPFFLFLTNGEYAGLERRQQAYLMKFHHTYSGDLFRYAYLMPNLREENYPFDINQMAEVPNEVIYRWLKNTADILCFGYDKNANWYDKTASFNQHLTKEVSERKLNQYTYLTRPATQFNQTTQFMRELTYPDETLCQYTCDQDKQCQGFVFQDKSESGRHLLRCQYFSTAYQAGGQPCEGCQVYQKSSQAFAWGKRMG